MLRAHNRTPYVPAQAASVSSLRTFLKQSLSLSSPRWEGLGPGRVSCLCYSLQTIQQAFSFGVGEGGEQQSTWS